MTDFDAEYSSTQGFYGKSPSPQLELFINYLNLPAGGTAIDIGCGDGRNALYLARLGYEVIGIDQSEAGIQNMVHAGDQEGLHITGITHDVRTYEYPPNFYRLVVANTILDHLNVEEGDALARSIGQCISPGGYLFVTVFTVDDPGFVGKSQSNTNRYVNRYFKPEELRNLFDNLTLLRFQVEEYLDTGHGKPHVHTVARLMAQKPE